MEPIVDLAPGAEDNALAVELADRIRQNLAEKPAKQADFRSLRGSVLVARKDEGESITLRFDHGRLTLHEGQVGIPMVSFCGDTADLRRLVDLPITRLFRLPLSLPFGGSAVERAAFQGLTRLLAKGQFRVYGLLAHPLLVLRLLRIVSRH